MNLKTRDNFKVGYSLGATHTPLEYLISSNPKTAVMPRGFRDLLREQCPAAWFELCNNRKVHGFRFRDIIERNYD